jgi:hypothetical protein
MLPPISRFVSELSGVTSAKHAMLKASNMTLSVICTSVRIVVYTLFKYSSSIYKKVFVQDEDKGVNEKVPST